MIRRIINVDGEKCNGCGACARACHEGAIDIIDGKARLTRENYCDGLGDCLPECPTGAITFEEREAPAYDEAAVLASKQGKQSPECSETAESWTSQSDSHQSNNCQNDNYQSDIHHSDNRQSGIQVPASRLAQWPCQMKLVPVSAPYFKNAELLIAADCTAYSYADFHDDFMKGRITLIGCPKLDAVDYSIKLTEILKYNDIKSITLLRMEVPCCGGLEMMAKKALLNSGKPIPLQVITLSIDGKIL